MSAHEEEEAVQALVALEARRCRAEMESDTATLGDLLADDFVYVHVSGTLDTKANVIASRAVQKFADMERHDLAVRVNGDLAVMSGRLTFRAHRLGSPDVRSVEAFATQVLVRGTTGWRYVLHQATLLSMTNAPADGGFGADGS